MAELEATSVFFYCRNFEEHKSGKREARNIRKKIKRNLNKNRRGIIQIFLRNYLEICRGITPDTSQCIFPGIISIFRYCSKNVFNIKV